MSSFGWQKRLTTVGRIWSSRYGDFAHSCHMTSLLEAMKRRPRSLTNLAREDRVVLFPSLGQLSEDGEHWLVHVHGDVFSPGKISLSKRLLLRLLRRTMRAGTELFTSPLFQERIARFIARSRAGRRIAVRIGEETFRLSKQSRRNGHFQAAVRIPVRKVRDWAETAAVGYEKYLPLEVCGAEATGQAYVLEPTGLSIISDI